ncbi:FK506-binding protein-like [Strix uralensis]|uniref:FK506-binding protein-like n=1 Tax=Strix uralensis TaxID=36305 RepID=UPI003DA66AED
MEGRDSANEEVALRGAANGANAVVAGPANGQRAHRGLSNGERGSPVPANDGHRGACAVEESSRGTALSNEGRGSRGSANAQLEGERVAGSSANEERGGLRGPSRGDTGPQDQTNEMTGCQGPAKGVVGLRGATNEEAEPHDLTNETKGPQHPANEDAAPEAPANEDVELRAPANKDTVPHVPVNEDTAPEAPTNRDSGFGVPTNERAGCRDPTNAPAALLDPANGASPHRAEPSNEQAAPLAPANGAADPWDWSCEEAWLRAPEGEEEEGEEGWGQLEEEEEEEEELEEQEGGGGDPWARSGAPPGWWLSPDAAFAKRVLRRGRGLGRPGPGSRCRVRLEAPGPPAGAGGGRWRTLRLGGGEGRWAAALDACLETMAAGERARLRPAGAAAALGVRLGGFSPAPPFWEEAPGGRWREVLARQERAAALLGAGAAGPAARAYAQALRAAVAAGGAPPLPPALARPKAELHAGLALCQLRLGLPAAAAANAGKALALRPGHLEARFRRALAAAAMSDLEAAAADLALVLREEPGHAGARRELRRVRGAARERDARLARRLGRLFA